MQHDPMVTRGSALTSYELGPADAGAAAGAFAFALAMLAPISSSSSLDEPSSMGMPLSRHHVLSEP